MEPIGRESDPCSLLSPTTAWRIRPMIIETYLTLCVIDVHVR
jgi:hypothetical protein